MNLTGINNYRYQHNAQFNRAHLPQFKGISREMASLFFRYPAQQIANGNPEATKAFLKDFKTNVNQLQGLSINELQSAFSTEERALLLTRLKIDYDLPQDIDRSGLMVQLKLTMDERFATREMEYNLRNALYNN